MKSNEKYVFSLIYYLRRCLGSAKFYVNMPGDLDHVIIFDVIYSTNRLVYNMNECRMCEKAGFNAIFLMLRFKLEDFDQMASWGPV